MFNEKYNCSFGNRCIYQHIIRYLNFLDFSNKALFDYGFILKRTAIDIYMEINKPENASKLFWEVQNNNKLKRQFTQ